MPTQEGERGNASWLGCMNAKRCVLEMAAPRPYNSEALLCSELEVLMKKWVDWRCCHVEKMRWRYGNNCEKLLGCLSLSLMQIDCDVVAGSCLAPLSLSTTPIASQRASALLAVGISSRLALLVGTSIRHNRPVRLRGAVGGHCQFLWCAFSLLRQPYMITDVNSCRYKVSSVKLIKYMNRYSNLLIL